MWPFYKELLRKEGTKWDMPAMRKWLARQDLGNGFMTEKQTVNSTLSDFRTSGFYTSAYACDSSGPVLLNGFATAGSFRTSQEISNTNQIMFGLGGTAIARVRPNKPELDLSVTIGELRNISAWPKMIGSSMQHASTMRDLFRTGGDEYLNLQFGWAPLIRDVQAMAGVVARSRAMLKQYEREIGRLVRRRYQFDENISTVEGLSKEGTLTSSYDLLSGTPYSATWLSTRPTVVRPVEITRTVTKSYFTGGFRIYCPDLQYLDQYLAGLESKANALLGTRLDPEVLWNLQPWSWLADWAFNVGDVLSNISSFSDGVVMQYGYVMRETEISREIHIPSGIWRRTGPVTWARASNPFTVTVGSHVKTRVAASPFGFGLNSESFTERQWSILLALGMSKGLK
jgi:hypothetical protein